MRAPRASLKALPRARNVSSVVWWSSTGDLVSESRVDVGKVTTYWLNPLYTALVDSSPHVSPMHGAYGPETLCLSISIFAANWLFGRRGASSLEKVLVCQRLQGGDRVGRRLRKGRLVSSSHLCREL